MRSGQPTAPKQAPDLVAALGGIRKPASGHASDQKRKSTWKTILNCAVGIGVVLLAVYASVSPPAPGDVGPSAGSGNSAI
jgi:hypothetical protein